MNVIESFLTKTKYYKYPTIIIPQGMMLHSVGCPQPSGKVFVNNWNKESYTRASVHGFIDANTGDVYHTMPWTYRAPHSAGPLNDTHLGIEMCEPDCIKYTSGSKFTCSNIERAKKMVTTTYNSAVELFAMRCIEFKFDPLKDGVILSHSEAHARGLASNHGDPEHLWKGLGMSYTMNGFRKDVKAMMDKIKAESESNTMPELDGVPDEDKVPEANNIGLYKVQVGAFTKKENAQALDKKVKAKGFNTYVTKIDKYWKVQVGAFTKKKNADAMLKSIKDAGFTDAFITYIDNREEVDSEINVGDVVKVLNPVTYDGKKFKIYYSKYTVIEVKDNRIVIGVKGIVAGAFKKDDLKVIS